MTERIRRRASPAMFAVVALCFFFPFVSFACTEGSHRRVVTFSGIELVTGTDVTVNELNRGLYEGDVPYSTAPPEEDTSRRAPSNGFAVAAFVAAVTGIAAGFARGRWGSCAGALGAAAGVVSLVALRLDLAEEVGEDGEAPLVFIEPRFGYWTALVLFCLLAAANVVWLILSSGGRTRRAGAVRRATRSGFRN